MKMISFARRLLNYGSYRVNFPVPRFHRILQQFVFLGIVLGLVFSVQWILLCYYFFLIDYLLFTPLWSIKNSHSGTVVQFYYNHTKKTVYTGDSTHGAFFEILQRRKIIAHVRPQWEMRNQNSTIRAGVRSCDCEHMTVSCCEHLAAVYTDQKR